MFFVVVGSDVDVNVDDVVGVADFLHLGVFGGGAGGGYTSGSQSEPDDSREHTIS